MVVIYGEGKLREWVSKGHTRTPTVCMIIFLKRKKTREGLKMLESVRARGWFI